MMGGDLDASSKCIAAIHIADNDAYLLVVVSIRGWCRVLKLVYFCPKIKARKEKCLFRSIEPGGKSYLGGIGLKRHTLTQTRGHRDTHSDSEWGMDSSGTDTFELPNCWDQPQSPQSRHETFNSVESLCNVHWWCPHSRRYGCLQQGKITKSLTHGSCSINLPTHPISKSQSHTHTLSRSHHIVFRMSQKCHAIQSTNEWKKKRKKKLIICISMCYYKLFFWSKGFYQLYFCAIFSLNKCPFFTVRLVLL